MFFVNRELCATTWFHWKLFATYRGLSRFFCSSEYKYTWSIYCVSSDLLKRHKHVFMYVNNAQDNNKNDMWLKTRTSNSLYSFHLQLLHPENWTQLTLTLNRINPINSLRLQQPKISMNIFSLNLCRLSSMIYQKPTHKQTVLLGRILQHRQFSAGSALTLANL